MALPQQEDADKSGILEDFLSDPGYLYFLIQGDSEQVLQRLPDHAVDMCITSPPYWGQRKYEGESALGNEPRWQEYVTHLMSIFRHLKRVLKPDGSFWLNIGDTYVKKNLMGIPWRVALALQDDGWILRNAVVWDKMKGSPDNAKDKLRNVHEELFHFVLQPTYYYDVDAIRNEPGKPYYRDGTKPGDRWHIIPEDQWRKDGHYAVFPLDLCELPIKATCPVGGIVLDPFAGTGTALVEAVMLGRRGIGIDSSRSYLSEAEKRLARVCAEQRQRVLAQGGLFDDGTISAETEKHKMPSRVLRKARQPRKPRRVSSNLGGATLPIPFEDLR